MLSEKEELELLSLERARAGYASGGDTSSKEKFLKTPPSKSSDVGVWDKIKGGAEADASLLTGLTSGLLGRIGGTIGGLAGSVASGEYGTQKGVNRAAEVADEAQHALTYQPRGDVGREYLSAFSNLLDATKLAGLNPAQALTIGSASSPALAATKVGTRKAGDAIGQEVQKAKQALTHEKDGMSGVGAAMTAEDRMRMERAAALPVPIRLTKGEATVGDERFKQLQFERETAKSAKYGTPLRERTAETNENIQKNFDAWIDQTGAGAPELRATGKAVDDALITKMKAAKARYRAAYDAAEQSGEMRQPVNTEPFVNFIKENQSAAKLAPVIAAAENELLRLGGATRGASGELIPGAMRINDVEIMRKMIVKLSKADDTNSHYGGLANRVIDDMTEGKGGANYQRARQLFRKYANEFKNTGVIKKLVGTKPGTNDRAVALEDVFQHSILNGSMDDVRMVRKSLQTGGEKGSQAWKELQGQTVNYLKEQATKNASRDMRGNPIVSFSGLDKAVTVLDKDGKLDFIFGKRGAQQIRDIRDLSADVLTVPPGAVNTSGTSAALLNALGALTKGHLPTAFGKAVGIVGDAYQGYGTRKRVQDALNPRFSDMVNSTTPQP